MDSQNQMQGGSMQKAPDNKMVMSLLSYIGPLVIVSYITSKDDPIVKFHIKQGLAVFGLEVIVWILSSMMWQLWMIINIINLATLILSIIGIVNVTQGKQKELPLIGGFANSFSI